MSGGLTDHHVHFMAAAATLLSVDVSAAADLASLVATIAGGAPPQGWVRAWGYEEWRLAEKRHPHRDDLDRAVPGRPVVLHHRSGHAAVLNTPALAEAGIPHHPDGLLVDRHDLLERVPRLPARALRQAAAATSARWESAGVSAFVDATHTNGRPEIELLAEWVASGVIRQVVTAMVGAAHVADLPGHGASVGRVGVGHAKIMPAPDDPDRVARQVGQAHRLGFPVAVHVVDIDVLDSLLGALEASPPPPGSTDRIEHNSLCLPEQVERIAASGALVVVNPSFLVHRQAKYRAELTEVERAWLIRMGSLRRAGIGLRAGSDAPVVDCHPQEMIRAARAHPFAPAESLSAAEAESLLAPAPAPGPARRR